MQLSKDALEFISLLNQKKVKYLVVGGWAVSLHHKPRYTKDLDILIARDSQNAEKLMVALEEFGFGSVGIERADFEKPGYVIQLGVEPNRIDILTEIISVDFSQAWPNKVIIRHQEIDLPIISILDLIANKESAARDQDLVDAKNLKKLISKK